MSLIKAWDKLIKLVSVPILVVGITIDNNIRQRFLDKRLTTQDLYPHLLVLGLGAALYLAYLDGLFRLDLSKVNNLLPTIINVQGVFFAASLAVSTFILTVFRPTELAHKQPDNVLIILDIVDDLRIANRIVFFSTLYVLIIWLLIATDYVQNSIPLTISMICFLVWSIMAIDSIIRGVFDLVKI